VRCRFVCIIFVDDMYTARTAVNVVDKFNGYTYTIPLRQIIPIGSIIEQMSSVLTERACLLIMLFLCDTVRTNDLSTKHTGVVYHTRLIQPIEICLCASECRMSHGFYTRSFYTAGNLPAPIEC